MKRGGPIERKTELRRTGMKPPTVEQVRAWWAKPRKPLPKIGAKARRERVALDTFRAVVKANAGGMCEAAGMLVPLRSNGHGEAFAGFVCGYGGSHPGHEAHHVWPEDRDAGRHEPARGMWLCTFGHDWVTRNPKDAAKLGLLRPESGHPVRRGDHAATSG